MRKLCAASIARLAEFPNNKGVYNYCDFYGNPSGANAVHRTAIHRIHFQ